MVEIVLMLWILPKRMIPLARERGKSGLLWTLAAIGAWLGAEILIIGIYVIVHLFGVAYLGWEDIEKQTSTYFVYFLALVCGLVSADMVRRLLTRIPTVSPFDQHPPQPPHEWRAE